MEPVTCVSIADWAFSVNAGGGTNSHPAVAAPCAAQPLASVSGDQGTIRVAVRVRPLVAREVSEGAAQGLEVDEGNGCVTAAGSRYSQARRFTFDHVFGPNTERVRPCAHSRGAACLWPCQVPSLSGCPTILNCCQSQVMFPLTGVWSHRSPCTRLVLASQWTCFSRDTMPQC